MPRLPLTGVFALVTIGVIACAPERPDERHRAREAEAPNADVALVVDGEPVTLQEFQRRIERLPPWGQARLGTVDARTTHLMAVADFELLADEAVRRGYEEDPRVIDRVKQVVANKEREQRMRGNAEMPDLAKADTSVDHDALERAAATLEAK